MEIIQKRKKNQNHTLSNIWEIYLWNIRDADEIPECTAVG